MKLYVGNLAYSVEDQDLQDFFATVGAVISATVIKDKLDGRSKGFGFVEMADDEAGKSAINSLNGKELKGRAIVVSEARPQENRRPNGNGRNFERNSSRRY